MLMDMAGGQPGPILEAVSPEHLPAAPAIRLRPARLRALLGLEIPAAEVEDILQRLGLSLIHI